MAGDAVFGTWSEDDRIELADTADSRVAAPVPTVDRKAADVEEIRQKIIKNKSEISRLQREIKSLDRDRVVILSNN